MTTEQSDDRTVPKLYDWALSVYKRMYEGSHMEPIVEGNPPVRVYEGHLTNLCRDLDVPNPYYTKIMRALKQLNCVEQLRRGGGSAMSKWILREEPKSEDFVVMVERRTQSQNRLGQLEQQIRDLRRLVTLQGERTELAHERLDAIENREAVRA